MCGVLAAHIEIMICCFLFGVKIEKQQIMISILDTGMYSLLD